mmetsp:Transcript_5729/g.13257  ORF Transcript_5729/g.13257 Transcript_5729/m.13257 type:complete len:99 (+) Transcript_5729:4931-5227(+)
MDRRVHRSGSCITRLTRSRWVTKKQKSDPTNSTVIPVKSPFSLGLDQNAHAIMSGTKLVTMYQIVIFTPILLYESRIPYAQAAPKASKNPTRSMTKLM